MRKNEWKRERGCTNKKAFANRFYAEAFAANVLGNPEMQVYNCGYCGEFHLTSGGSKHGKRQRQTSPARN